MPFTHSNTKVLYFASDVCVLEMPRQHRPRGVPYPDWLRAEVLDSHTFESSRDVAEKWSISQSTVIRIWRDSGAIQGKTGTRLQLCSLTEDDAAFLCLLKVTYPQASLSECQLALEIERGKVVSLSTVSRELRRLGMTRKKMERFSTRRDEDRRVSWWTTPPHMGGCAGVDWSNIVDIDESNVRFGDSQRRYGHSFAGMPARYPSWVSF